MSTKSRKVPQEREGFKDYQSLQGRTSLRDYPWKTIATNVAGVGAGAGLGYVTAGALTRAAHQGPLGRFLQKLSPAQRAGFWTAAGGGAATLGLAARRLSSVAGQARIAEEMARRDELKNQQAQQTQKAAMALTPVGILAGSGLAGFSARKESEKTASLQDVVRIYGLAMEPE